MNTIPLQLQCVGRLTVALPAKPKVTCTQQFDGAEVSRLEGVVSKEQFWRAVEDRRKALESLPHESEKTQLSLYQVVGDNAAVALYRDSDVWTGGYKMDRFLWLGTRGYLLRSPAAGNEIREQIPAAAKFFFLS